jgi:hypothetical protein
MVTAIWAVVVIITDGVEAEDIITGGGIAVSEYGFRFSRSRLSWAASFISWMDWACDVFVMEGRRRHTNVGCRKDSAACTRQSRLKI